MQRKGKIARLPLALRTELNQRLDNNEDGANLLNWLNALPGVPAMLARDFAGEPISKQNLYESPGWLSRMADPTGNVR